MAIVAALVMIILHLTGVYKFCPTSFIILALLYIGDEVRHLRGE